MMPQWHFLDFLREEAEALPGFHLEMSAPVESFVTEAGRVVGVRLADGRTEHAKLVIAADGRTSLARQVLPLKTLGAAIDVLWFRLSKPDSGPAGLRGLIQRGGLLVMIDRGDYWQCAFVIAKGAASALLAQGIEHFRILLARAAPEVVLTDLRSTDDIKLLSVALDRLEQWWQPGLLALGDSAHAMSPIGGVGINLAVQDAVAAANFLAEQLARGTDVDPLLSRVQSRRLLPTRVIQRLQKLAQDRVIARVLQPGAPIAKAPWIVRLLDRQPLLRRIPGYLIGLGVRRERVRSAAISQEGRS
jgi:2-polyprenyl-6-methoxyphenol hydroxylase-like FAD-dependent oxidoreductase